MAPDHQETRQARAMAWKALEPESRCPRGSADRNGHGAENLDGLERFLLWVDGVGGYLVCLKANVTLGQASLPESFVDVPLIADISRLHATLTRDAEGYLLQAVRGASVNGKPTERALLRHDDRITLGSSCQVQFRKPSSLSGTARLDLVSGHRLAVGGVDAVLLMADTLILGLGAQAHVLVPDLKQPVILFRNREGLWVRHAGGLTIDGQPVAERGRLKGNATVVGEGVSFAVEALTPR
jgi:hypothetical protein